MSDLSIDFARSQEILKTTVLRVEKIEYSMEAILSQYRDTTQIVLKLSLQLDRLQDTIESVREDFEAQQAEMHELAKENRAFRRALVLVLVTAIVGFLLTHYGPKIRLSSDGMPSIVPATFQVPIRK